MLLLGLPHFPIVPNADGRCCIRAIAGGSNQVVQLPVVVLLSSILLPNFAKVGFTLAQHELLLPPHQRFDRLPCRDHGLRIRKRHADRDASDSSDGHSRHTHALRDRHAPPPSLLRVAVVIVHGHTDTERRGEGFGVQRRRRALDGARGRISSGRRHGRQASVHGVLGVEGRGKVIPSDHGGRAFHLLPHGAFVLGTSEQAHKDRGGLLGLSRAGGRAAVPDHINFGTILFLFALVDIIGGPNYLAERIAARAPAAAVEVGRRGRLVVGAVASRSAAAPPVLVVAAGASEAVGQRIFRRRRRPLFIGANGKVEGEDAASVVAALAAGAVGAVLPRRLQYGTGRNGGNAGVPVARSAGGSPLGTSSELGCRVIALQTVVGDSGAAPIGAAFDGSHGRGRGYPRRVRCHCRRKRAR
mmetsp:Transcript_10405/g.30608  ORF Transcript_10405/g.30608 Transcript_10405/m.30608 type:complete len:414 (-) Transcript_10405:181-1422(-)